MKIYWPQEVNMEFVNIQNTLLVDVLSHYVLTGTCIIYIKWIDTK